MLDGIRRSSLEPGWRAAAEARMARARARAGDADAARVHSQNAELALAEPTGAKSHPSAWLTTVAEENLYADPPADPILALSVDDAGPIARLTASAYGTTGRRLESRRVFFTMPASMAAGDISGKYDEWTVAYDHMGRQVRTKEPSEARYWVMLDMRSASR